MKYKQSQNLKRIVSGLLSLTMITSMSAVIPANAEEESKQGVYPYAVFAADEHGGITLNLDYLTVYGNGVTNGVYSTTAMSPNINGTISENEFVVDEIVSDDENTTDAQDADKSFDISRDMIYIHNKLMDSWFNNAQNYAEDYTLSEMNINLNSPIYVTGRLNYEGNVSLNSAIGAVSDVNLSGGNLNGNNAVIYSKFGDIKIADSQASMNGLIYAPFGTVTIDCDNFNLNGLIIAQNVIVNSTGANINYSNTWAEFVGTETEELSWTFDDWKYLADTDEDNLPNLVEKEIGTKPYEADTDGDLLPDGYEVLSLGTDPSKIDTDDNGVSDYDEDFDADVLSNGQEYEIGTRPLNDDSDRDSLKDGDEVNTYFTNPLEVDTDMDGLNDDDEIYFGTDPNDSDSDENGVSDGDEKRSQTFIHKVENEDCAITEVIVSMEGTGNLQKTTEVESVMNKDFICTDVVGLVGEPFSIETTSKFDKATLSFKIDQSKLDDTELENLLFLWYDEDNYKFVELNTIYDEANSLVSIETTHFSRYMVVDKDKWFEAWNEELNYKSISYEVSAVYSVLAVDCSGSMSTYDTITIIPPTGSGSYKPVYSCERQKAVSGFTSALDLDDKAAIVTFESSASTVCELTDNTDKLYWGSAAFYNGGGTSFDAALRQSIDILQASSGGTRKRIILLSDGYSSVSDDIIKELKKDFIKVYTVGIGNCSDSVLREIATETGGEYIKAYKASDLVDIYADIGIGGDFDTTDTDGDGLYDAVESAGIRIQNGLILRNNPEKNIYFCDPTEPDTDHDGVDDGKEIDPTIRWRTGHSGKRQYYFIKYSNPNNKDSDGDKYDDNVDPNPMVSDVTVTKLKSDYLCVDYATASSLPEYNYSWKNHLGTDTKSKNTSFGGDQSWFKRVSGVDKGNPEYIAAQGCGLIAMADTMLYMSRKDSNYETSLTSSVSKNNPVTFEEYRDYVIAFNNEYVKLDVAIDLDIYFLWWKLGNIHTNTNDGNMGDILNDYFESNDLDLKAKWCYVENGIYAEGHWFETGTRARRVRDMLKNDIPAIISVGPGDVIKAYDIDDSSDTPAYKDTNQSISNHYFTITAVIDDKIKQKNGDYDAIMYEVSTWGQKYYISEKEIRDFIGTHSSLFTNVLYIEEKK